MFGNSLSLPVTDDNPDEFGSKMRSRPRRKRRKSEYRGRSDLGKRTCKQLTRWWPILILIAAVLLLVFETSKLGWRSSASELKHDIDVKKPNLTDSSFKKPEGNLNRLDAPRCLKLLPPEELENLDFPPNKDSFVQNRYSSHGDEQLVNSPE